MSPKIIHKIIPLVGRKYIIYILININTRLTGFYKFKDARFLKIINIVTVKSNTTFFIKIFYNVHWTDFYYQRLLICCTPSCFGDILKI